MKTHPALFLTDTKTARLSLDESSYRTSEWLLIVFFIAAALLCLTASGQNTWNGGGANALWSNPTNWSGNAVATNGASLVFAGSTKLSNTNDIIGLKLDSISYINSGFVNNSLTITNANYTPMLTNGIVDTAGNNTNNIPFILGGSTAISNQSTLTLVMGGTLNMSNRTLIASSSGGGMLFLNGVISGNGVYGQNSLSINDGFVRLGAANTFNGSVMINPGAAVQVANAGAFPNGANVGDVTNEGTIYLNATSPTINGLYGSGTIDNTNGTATYTVTVGNNSTNSGGVFSGTIQNTTGTVALSKVTTNAFALSGFNSYSGLTVVNGGTLVLAAGASLPNSPTINVLPGSVLDVSASGFALGASVSQTLIAGRATNNGPADVLGDPVSSGVINVFGPARGTLTFSSGLTINGGSVEFDLGNTTALGGGSNDLIVINGTLSLGSAAIKLNPFSGAFATGTYTLISNQTASVTGSAAALTVDPPRGLTETLDSTTTPGSLLVSISGTISPGSLAWSGSVSGDWDVHQTQNWVNLAGGTNDYFFDLDNVIFNDSASNATVNLPSGVSPASVTFNNVSSNYVISGFGAITGPTGLIVNGPGSVTLDTANSYTGPTTVNNGAMLALGQITSAPNPNISVYSGTAPGQVILNGGGVFLADVANINFNAIFNNVTLNAGAGSFCERARQSSSAYIIQIGTITRNVGGTVDFNNMQSKASNPACGLYLTNTPAVNGTLGGWATFGENDWVVPVGAGAAGSTAYAAYQTSTNATAWGATSNVNMSAVSPSASLNNTVINSLKLSGSAITINSGQALKLTSGGLLVPNGGTASSVNGGILQGATNADLVVLNNGTANLTISSTIADNTNASATAGSALTKSGQGTLILTGTETYTGPTYINGGTLALTGSGTATPNANFPPGTLQIGSGGTAGSIATSSGVIDNGNLAFSRSDVVTFSLPISGLGAVKNIGAGTTILTGNNSYSGATVASAGTLQVGNGGTVGSLGSSSSITDNGTLIFNRTDNVNLSGPIGGTGVVIQQGGGQLTLTGANTYQGNTVINSGSVALNAGGSLPNSAAIVVAGGSALDVSSIGTLALSGGAVQQILAGTGTIKGSVSTAAGVGPGTRISPGTNGVYGTLTITNALTVSGGTINFDISSGSKDLIAVGGNLALNSGTIALNVSGALPAGSYKLIQFGGSLSGSVLNMALSGFNQFGFVPSLVVNGNEIDLTVTAYVPVNLFWQGNGGNNLWDDATTADWTNSAGAASVFHQFDNATLDDTSPNTFVNLQSALTPSEVTINGSVNSYTLQGTGSLAGGNLTNNNPNTLTVLTTNSSTGVIAINAGTIQCGNGVTAGMLGGGTLINSGSLVFNEPDTEIFGGSISGGGSLTLASATTLALSANSTFSGPTTINGVLQVGAGGSSGSLGTGTVADNVSLVFNRQGTVAESGGISGSGTLSNINVGTLVLSGNNTYSGDTVIAEGTLKLGGSQVLATGASAGNVVLDGGASLAGTLDLNGFNQTINGLNGVTSNALGQVVNNGGTGINFLTVGNNDVSSTFTGLIKDNNGAGGTVALVKIGAGTLTLQPGGNGSTFTGGTSISNGVVTGGSSTTANATMCGAGPVIFGTNGTLELGGFTGSTSPDYGTFPNPVIIPANTIATVRSTSRGGGFAPSSVTAPSSATLFWVSRYLRGALGGNWVGFNGLLIVTNTTAGAANGGGQELRLNTATGFPNGRLLLASGQVGNTTNYNLVTGTPTIPIGELAGDTNAVIALNGGASGGQPAIWNVGGLNTSAEYDGAIYDTHGIIKSGTGSWTLTSGNLTYSGPTTVSNGVLILSATATLANSATITLSAPGKLDVSASGTFTLGGSPAQTLRGNGTLLGSLLVSASGTLMPGFGDSPAVLTVTNDVNVGGTVTMLVNLTNAPATNSLLVSQTLTAGGTLTVTNTGPDIVNGDRFVLFSVPASGFTTINLPTTTSFGSSYIWATNLAVDGSIQVVGGGASVANAAFTYNPGSGPAPLLVTFHNTSTGVFTNAVWNYGDGVTETNMNLTVTHTYTVSPSSNTVSLTVTDTYGSTNIFTVNNAVVVGSVAANTPPRITSIKSSGGNVTIIGTNAVSAAGHPYYLLGSTNVSIVLSNWSALSTNSFATDGGFTNVVPNTGVKQFYIIAVPQP